MNTLNHNNCQIVGLITDFGLKDSYVAEIKIGLISVNRHISIIDISHEIDAGNISDASYLLGRIVNKFPKDSIFLSIIDPGVGTARQAVMVRNNGYFFIGPDNGVFSSALCWEQDIEVRILSNDDVESEVSATFHGRDIFAPVTAKIASGIPFNSIGKKGFLTNTFRPENPAITDFGLEGEIVYIDKFGNISTNLIGTSKGFICLKPDYKLTYYENYKSAPSGELFWLIGSDGFIEIALNRGNAGKKLNARVGDLVYFESLKLTKSNIVNMV